MFCSYNFLSRDTMRKSGAGHRSMSVCPSVILLYLIENDKDIITLFSRPRSAITLVSPILPSAKDNPLNVAVKYTTWKFFCDFLGNGTT